MRQKSLRQLARELGISHSYLSQIKHGKRPPSAKVVSKMVSNGKQLLSNSNQNDRLTKHGPLAQLAEQLTLNSKLKCQTVVLASKQCCWGFSLKAKMPKPWYGNCTGGNPSGI